MNESVRLWVPHWRVFRHMRSVQGVCASVSCRVISLG